MLAKAFLQPVNEQVALGFDVVFHVKNALALGALCFFQFADLSLERVLLVNGGGEPRLAIEGFQTLLEPRIRGQGGYHHRYQDVRQSPILACWSMG